MKTAREILLEVIHRKDAARDPEIKAVLELLADLARVAAELEHHHVPSGGEAPAKEIEPAQAPL